MPVCPRCNKRSAKRACPALRTSICPVCCARERAFDLACPETCSYLRDAQVHAGRLVGELRAKDRAFDRAFAAATPRSLPLVFVLQDAILDVYRGVNGSPVRGLKDDEILEGVENAKKNLETEDSGLIYEHQATPRVNQLSKALRDAVNEIGERLPADSRLRRSEVLGLLELMRAWVEAHIRNSDEDTSYLRYISLFKPWPLETTKPLII